MSSLQILIPSLVSLSVVFHNFDITTSQILVLNPSHPLCTGKDTDLCRMESDPHFCTFDNVMHHYQAPAQLPFYYIDGWVPGDNRLCANGFGFPCVEAMDGLPFEVIGTHKPCWGDHSCLDYFVIRLYDSSNPANMGTLVRKIKLEAPSQTRTIMTVFDENDEEIESLTRDSDLTFNGNTGDQIGSIGSFQCDRVERSATEVFMRCRFEYPQIQGNNPTSHGNTDGCGQCNDADMIVEMQWQTDATNMGRIWLTDWFQDRAFGLCGTFDGVQETEDAILQRSTTVTVRRLEGMEDGDYNMEYGMGSRRDLLQTVSYTALNWCDMQDFWAMDTPGWQKTNDFGNSWIANDTVGVSLPDTPIVDLPDRSCIERATWHCSNVWNDPFITNCLSCENELLTVERPFGLTFGPWLQNCVYDSCAEAAFYGVSLEDLSLNALLDAGVFETAISQCTTSCLPIDDGIDVSSGSPTEEPTEEPTREPIYRPIP